MRPNERGFTLIELLVTLGILAVITTAFYQLMLSGTRASNVTRNVVRVSEEARLGLNRLVRDTREAVYLENPTATSYTAAIDFDGDGVIETHNGIDYERITFGFDGSAITIEVQNRPAVTLVQGVSQIGSIPVFQYSSNKLEHDTNADGVTTLAELDAAAAQGATLGDTTLLLGEVSFTFRVTSGDSTTDFYSKSTMRNIR